MTYPTKKLGEVITLHYGKGISKSERKSDGKYPIYGANGELGRTDKYLVVGEAVIVGRKGSAGEVTRVSGRFWSSDVTYYVLGNEKVDIDYIFHLLKSLDLPSMAVGVKPGINRNRVYDIEIPLPTLIEQKEIVAKLESLLGKTKEAKRLRKEAQEATQNLLPTELHKIFEKDKKENWNEYSLGDISNLKTGGTPSRKKPEYFGGNIKWLVSGDIHQKNITECKGRLTEEGLKNSNARYLPLNSILIALNGQGKTKSTVAMLRTKATCNQSLVAISPHANVMLPEFLYYQLNGRYKEIRSLAGSNSRKGLNMKIISKLKVVSAPISEQKKIVARLDALSEKIQKLQEYQQSAASDLSILEQSILHKAFEEDLLN